MWLRVLCLEKKTDKFTNLNRQTAIDTQRLTNQTLKKVLCCTFSCYKEKYLSCLQKKLYYWKFLFSLKGLGHATVGNFSTDQIVIETDLTNIKITAQNYRRTLAKHRKAKKGHWTKLERIKMDCIWVNLKNVGSPFFKFSVCQFIHLSKCHSHSWKIIFSCYMYVPMILPGTSFSLIRLII